MGRDINHNQDGFGMKAGFAGEVLQGEPGPAGKSVYQYAVEHGYQGTEEEYGEEAAKIAHSTEEAQQAAESAAASAQTAEDAAAAVRGIEEHTAGDAAEAKAQAQSAQAAAAAAGGAANDADRSRAAAVLAAQTASEGAAAAAASKEAAQQSAHEAKNSRIAAVNAKDAAVTAAGGIGDALARAEYFAGKAEGAKDNVQANATAAETAKNDAVAAKGSAEAAAASAAESAEQAATAVIRVSGAEAVAATAAARAESAVGKVSYVGENGNWFQWDEEVGEFVDTGYPARGPEGPEGPAGSAGGKSYATFVIGSSQAGYTENDVDYLCDGVDDQVEINAAIAALPTGTNGGGTVLLLDGTYNISSDIHGKLNCYGVALRGAGKNATRLVETANFDSNMFLDTHYSNFADIRDFTIVLNDENQLNSAIYTGGNTVIENVRIQNVFQYGISSGYSNTIRQCDISASQVEISDNSCGVITRSDYSLVDNCTIFGFHYCSIKLSYSGHTLRNLNIDSGLDEADAGSAAIIVRGKGEKILVQGVKIRGYEIFINTNSSNSIIAENICPEQFIVFNSTAHNNMVIGNICGEITDNGTNNIIIAGGKSGTGTIPSDQSAWIQDSGYNIWAIVAASVTEKDVVTVYPVLSTTDKSTNDAIPSAWNQLALVNSASGRIDFYFNDIPTVDIPFGWEVR